MQRSTIENAWFEYTNDITPVEVKVVFAEELFGRDAPRPEKPYITLKIINGPQTLGADDDERYDGVAKKMHLCGMRQYTISIQGFGVGDDGLNPHDYVAKVSTMLDSKIASDILKVADIAIVDRGEVLDISSLLEVGYERRAQLDVIFNSSSDESYDVDTIEKVIAQGEVDGKETEEIFIDGTT